MTTDLVLTPEQRRILAHPRLLIIDFEMTCGPGVTPGAQDIIEVGMCVLDREVLVQASDAVSVYVRPVRSQITPFCEKLTGITAARVAGEPTFPEVAPALRAFAQQAGVGAWVAWGDDYNVLHRQCVGAGVESPFEGIEFIDARKPLTSLIYAATGLPRPKGSAAGVGVATATKALGLEFEGRAHSGAFDAFNTARVLQELQRLTGYKDAPCDAWRTLPAMPHQAPASGG